MENGVVGDVGLASPLNGETSGHGDVTTDRSETNQDGGSVPQSTDIAEAHPAIAGKLSPSSTDDDLPANNADKAPSIGEKPYHTRAHSHNWLTLEVQFCL